MITRYDIEGEDWGEYEEDVGDWVKYNDHIKEVESITQKNKELEDKIDEFLITLKAEKNYETMAYIQEIKRILRGDV